MPNLSSTFHAGDSSAMLLVMPMLRPKLDFKLEATPLRELRRRLLNRPVRLPMAAADRDHAIQPVVVRVRGLE